MRTDKWCYVKVNEHYLISIVTYKVKCDFMKKFLCTFSLPKLLEESFWEQIPSHRQHINTLMSEETIVTYSVNHNRSKGWVVINANSETHAQNIIEKFPIRRFINYQIDELFIFDSMIGAPRLVLN